MPLTVNIIILNYNGNELLPQCLPSIVEASHKSHYPCRVTLLDNQSKDDGVAWVEKNYPEVQIIHAPQNRILCSYNECIENVNEDIVILLNNDIRVAPDFVNPLIRPFKDNAQLFLVAPQVMDFEGKNVEAGRSRSGIKAGLFWCNARYPGYETELMTASETDNSGFGAFSRQKFLELNGYDDLYFPGIMEDVDICYRAKEAGYHLRYEPQSVVYHIGQASFKKTFGSKQILILAHRNTFLFMWKNFKSPAFWISHIFFLPARLLWSLLKGDTTLIMGFNQAIQRLESIHFPSCHSRESGNPLSVNSQSQNTDQWIPASAGMTNTSDSKKLMTISVVLIVLNEERNIEECLKTLSWVDEIIVMDSGSTDKTLELARKLNAKTYDNPFVNYSTQKNSAMQKATSDWILMVDADERITPELAQEIQSLIYSHPKDAVYAIRRINYFFGKPLRFSNAKEDWPIRLFPKNKAHYEQPVHEYIVSDFPVKKISQPMLHYSTLDYGHYQLKLKRYIPHEIEILRERGCSFPLLKMMIMPIAKFSQLYFLGLGILDGVPGLKYSLLSSYYAFLKYKGYATSKHTKAS